MKKNTVKVLVLALALAGTLPGFAQQIDNAAKKAKTNELMEMSRAYHAKATANREEAIRQAKINNWPLVIRENGGYAELVNLNEDGTPLYLSTFNQGAAKTSGVNQIQPGGSLGLDLTGKGMKVAVWDGEYPLTTHRDFAGRINPIGGSPATNNASHPTHVLGTILGSGSIDKVARGMAYEADGEVSSFTDDFAEIARAAGNYILSNHSYGDRNASQSARGYYGQSTQAFDEIAFIAPTYQMVVAAGNDNSNGRYDLLSGRSVAKNSLIVAAIREFDPASGNSAVIADFSSWGPTDDNRIKPDISNKGVDVYSTTNTSNTAYEVMSGTSMATPATTGALLLVQQHYGNLHEGEYMLSSTLRALVAHTAIDAGNVGPDPVFGWGVLNARKMVETITNEKVSSIIKELTLLPGQTYQIAVNATGNEDLVSTLAWTDPAHAPTGGVSLVNNLDIRVTKGSTTYFPWKLGATPSANALKADNNVDNIEKTEIANPAGKYIITVSHKGSTLVNPGGTPSQVFSLVISGGVETALATDDFTANVFTMWPNPANNVLNISLNSGAEQNANTIVYDIQGRVVLQQKLVNTKSEINVESLKAGVYFVNTINGDKHQVTKVVKN